MIYFIPTLFQRWKSHFLNSHTLFSAPLFAGDGAGPCEGPVLYSWQCGTELMAKVQKVREILGAVLAVYFFISYQLDGKRREKII